MVQHEHILAVTRVSLAYCKEAIYVNVITLRLRFLELDNYTLSLETSVEAECIYNDSAMLTKSSINQLTTHSFSTKALGS